MFLGGGGDILDEFRRMERAMTRGAMDPRRTGGGAALASRSAGTNNNNYNSSSEVRYSSSSYTYSYRSGGSDAGGDDTTPAQHFEYTAQSRGVHDGRQAVTETKRSYRDSTGRERHGVARTVGDRGRRVTRERDGASGEERCEERLLATEDGDGFDRDWSAAAEAAQLMNPRRFPSLDALASELTSDAFPFALTRGRSTHAGGRAPESPSDGDRRIASAARETHAARTRGLAEEARRMARR